MKIDDKIFKDAVALIGGDRLEDYGHPAESFERFAHAFTAVLLHKLKQPISAKEAALMMAAFKLCREANKPKEDNRTDGAAYILLADIIDKTPPDLSEI